MQTLSLSDCDIVGGGNAYAAAGLLLAIIVNSGTLTEFCAGVLDGFNKSKPT